MGGGRQRNFDGGCGPQLGRPIGRERQAPARLQLERAKTQKSVSLTCRLLLSWHGRARRCDPRLTGMNAALEHWISLSRMPTTRRLYALESTRRALLEVDEPELRDLVDGAIEHEKTTLNNEIRWQEVRGGRAEASPATKKIAELDRHLDTVLAGLAQTLDGLAKAFAVADGGERGRRAEELRAALFPRGVGAVVHLAYIDELDEVDRMLSELDGPARECVVDLHLGDIVEQLRLRASEFRQALDEREREQPEVTYDCLRGQRLQGHTALLQFVACVLGRFSDGSARDVEMRGLLLAAIAKQNDDVAEARRHKRRPSDVCIETGRELPAGKRAADAVASGTGDATAVPARQLN